LADNASQSAGSADPAVNRAASAETVALAMSRDAAPRGARKVVDDAEAAECGRPWNID